MAIEIEAPRSRRALLIGAISGALASVGLLSKPQPVSAGVDGDLVLGAVNTSNAQTELQANTGSAGIKVVGTGIGLQGWADIGVDGYGTTIGVNAVSDGAGGPGVVAYNRADGTGLFGWTTDGNQSPPTMPAKRGVYGLSEAGVGVNGASTDGIGVRGESVNGVGVLGVGPIGFVPDPIDFNAGVYGAAGDDPGVYGHGESAAGVFGSSNTGDGVYGNTVAGGFHPAHATGAGVHGHGGLAGLYGTGDSSFGVLAQSNSVPAIYALNNSATAAAIVAEGDPGTAIHGHANAGGANQVNIPNSPALTGIYGSATGIGTAIAADSASGLALQATSSAGNAIRGRGQADGVVGESSGGKSGVVGFSGPGVAAAGPAKTGVYGEANQDAAARGVFGKSTVGSAVRGEATSGIGVQGIAGTGTGVHAATSAPGVGVALQAVGRVRFDNASGVATILAGSNNVYVVPGIVLTASTAVVATLLGSAGGTTTVHRVAVNTASKAFRIYLTANATVAARVAWHCFG